MQVCIRLVSWFFKLHTTWQQNSWLTWHLHLSVCRNDSSPISLSLSPLASWFWYEEQVWVEIWAKRWQNLKDGLFAGKCCNFFLKSLTLVYSSREINFGVVESGVGELKEIPLHWSVGARITWGKRAVQRGKNWTSLAATGIRWSAATTVSGCPPLPTTAVWVLLFLWAVVLQTYYPQIDL